MRIKVYTEGVPVYITYSTTFIAFTNTQCIQESKRYSVKVDDTVMNKQVQLLLRLSYNS